MMQLRDIVFLLLLFSLTSSCVSYNELVYFRKDDVAIRQLDSMAVQVTNSKPLEIQKHDILAISVRTFDQELAIPFNISNSGGLTQGSTPFNTYQVDEGGFVDFPVLGDIHLAGKTINQAKDTIKLLLQSYLQAPSLTMRLINFKVSVLGEVNRPGTFSVESDKFTLLEAIGLAEDITPYGNIEDILIIREQNGVRSLGEVNLQTTNFIHSEYFYLKQGDVIYVEPRKDKKAVVKDNLAKYATLVGTTIQAIVTVATFIIIANR